MRKWKMGLGLAAAAWLLVACTVAIQQPAAEEPQTRAGAETPPTEPAAEMPQTEPAGEPPPAEPAVEAPASMPAPVSSVTVERRDSGTVIVVSGELPDPCHEVQAGSASVEGDTITVDVTMTPPAPDIVCAQVITPYTVEIPVEAELSAGAYQVDINRQVVEVTME